LAYAEPLEVVVDLVPPNHTETASFGAKPVPLTVTVPPEGPLVALRLSVAGVLANVDAAPNASVSGMSRRPAAIGARRRGAKRIQFISC
jgi:hypothetical protein